MCSWCMWENLLACVNFVLWTWQNFVGMCMDIYKVIGNFFGYCGKFLLGMWEFICAWSCGWEFFHGHVEIFFLHGYGKIWWLYEYVINLVVVKFWWGIDLILWWGIDCRNIFWVWKFFDYMFLVMEIDELNFYVAESQESRESPNVEKCMGITVS